MLQILEKRILISQHMTKRLKERLGMPKRAVKRYVLSALNNGTIIESFNIKNSQKIVIDYKGHLLIFFEQSSWISFATVLCESSSKHNYYKSGKKFYDNPKNHF